MVAYLLLLGAQLLHALRFVGAQRGDLALERVFGGRVPRLDLAHCVGERERVWSDGRMRGRTWCVERHGVCAKIV